MHEDINGMGLHPTNSDEELGHPWSSLDLLVIKRTKIRRIRWNFHLFFILPINWWQIWKTFCIWQIFQKHELDFVVWYYYNLAYSCIIFQAVMQQFQDFIRKNNQNEEKFASSILSQYCSCYLKWNINFKDITYIYI